METDIWAWVHRYMADTSTGSDENRRSLCRSVMGALEGMRTHPDRSLRLLARAREIAVERDEPWWVLFCDHWSLQTLLFRKRDYARALPLAQAAVAESDKPLYRDFPQRNCLQEDLISAYQGIDPLGFAPEIEASLARMEAEVPPQSSCFHCLQGLRAEFLLDGGRLDEARDQALLASKRAALASDYHHVAGAYVLLCRIASRQPDWDRLAQWSLAGDMFTGRDTDEAAIAELWMWNAVSRRRSGDVEAGARQYLKARRETRGSDAVPSAGFFDAWALFHETGGHLRAALRVRDRELSMLQNGGQTSLLCRCHLKRCRLQATLGQPFDTEAAAIKALSASLRDPGPLLAELRELVS